MERFSTRHGFESPDPEITITRDAPRDLRDAVVSIAYEAGINPKWMRSIVCGLLRVREDPNNWSEFPNVDYEVREHIDNCEWFEVYDIIEACYESLLTASKDAFRHSASEVRPAFFFDELNRCFRKKGIGWQLIDGHLQVRGEEDFQTTVTTATTVLEETGRVTAAKEIHQAILDLSRRPEPDITGALQHGLAALECVLRDICNDPRATLGTLLSKYKGEIPPPLDQAIQKIWGFASEYGRHIQEGREPDYVDAALVVQVSAAVATYLSKKNSA